MSPKTESAHVTFQSIASGALIVLISLLGYFGSRLYNKVDDISVKQDTFYKDMYLLDAKFNYHSLENVKDTKRVETLEENCKNYDKRITKLEYKNYGTTYNILSKSVN